MFGARCFVSLRVLIAKMWCLLKFLAGQMMGVLEELEAMYEV
jgi:hypothetical protein